MAGLDTSKALFVPLLEKKGKVTSAALVGQLEGNPKALVLMMGGNHLPSEAGCAPWPTHWDARRLT